MFTAMCEFGQYDYVTIMSNKVVFLTVTILATVNRAVIA